MKVQSTVEFKFKYDGSIEVELGPKPTEVSELVGEALLKRYPFVTKVEAEVKEKTQKESVKKADEVVEEVAEEKVEVKADEVVEEKVTKKVKDKK